MINVNKILPMNRTVILAILLSVFILFPLPLPFELATYIDTKLGSLFIVALSIFVFVTVSPVVGILAFIAGYSLLYRAGVSTGSEVLRQYIPSEDDKQQEMLNLHALNNGKSLEEEAVDNIPPHSPDGDILPEDPYDPIYSSSSIEHTTL
tara:strand:- start:365 stop:814 length:450 start_codon:yes stop_codon:yes gene_type:complete